MYFFILYTYKVAMIILVLGCTQNDAVLFFLLFSSALVMITYSQSFVITGLDILFNEIMKIAVPFRYQYSLE